MVPSGHMNTTLSSPERWKLSKNFLCSPLSPQGSTIGIHPAWIKSPGDVQEPNAWHTIIKIYIGNAIQHVTLPHHIGVCQNTHTQVQQQVGMNQSELNKTPRESH